MRIVHPLVADVMTTNLDVLCVFIKMAMGLLQVDLPTIKMATWLLQYIE